MLAHTITVIAVQAAAADEALDDRPDDAHARCRRPRRHPRAMVELRGTVALARRRARRTGGSTAAQLARTRGRGAGRHLTVSASPDSRARRAGGVPDRAGSADQHRPARRGVPPSPCGRAGAPMAVEVTDDGAGAVRRRGSRPARHARTGAALGGTFEAGARQAGRGPAPTACPLSRSGAALLPTGCAHEPFGWRSPTTRPLVRAGFRALLAHGPGHRGRRRGGRRPRGRRARPPGPARRAAHGHPHARPRRHRGHRRDLRRPRAGGVRVVVLTTYRPDEYVFGALRAGACGLPAQGRRARRVCAPPCASSRPATRCSRPPSRAR